MNWQWLEEEGQSLILLMMLKMVAARVVLFPVRRCWMAKDVCAKESIQAMTGVGDSLWRMRVCH